MFEFWLEVEARGTLARPPARKHAQMLKRGAVARTHAELHGTHARLPAMHARTPELPAHAARARCTRPAGLVARALCTP